MTEPAITRPSAPVSRRSDLGAVHAPHEAGSAPADPTGLDELGVMLRALLTLNLDGIVPTAEFDPSWPEGTPQ